MTIRNRIIENFGISHLLRKHEKYNRIKRLKYDFPNFFVNIENNLPYLTDDEINGIENNEPIRYVSPGIYISEDNYSRIPNHNIENIEDYINEDGSPLPTICMENALNLLHRFRR